MKILVFGEICYDIFIYGSSVRLSPEAPVPVFVPEREDRNFGMGGNVVENLKAICDCDVQLFSQSEIIKKTRYVDEKSNHMFLRVDEGETTIKPLELNKDIFEKIKDSDIVIVSDYDKGFLSEWVIAKIGFASKLSIIDAKKKLNRQIVSAFSFIKLNEMEFIHNKDLFTGLENKLLITLGIKGCKYDGKIYPPINPQYTMDVSGAGDTFTSAFIVKYYQTKDIPQSIEFANEMASIVVSKRGVKTP